MPEAERVRRARGLTRAVLTRNPVRWLTAQLRDLDVVATMGADPSQGAEDFEETGRAFDQEVGGQP